MNSFLRFLILGVAQNTLLDIFIIQRNGRHGPQMPQLIDETG